MKRLLITLALLSASAVASAKQCVEYFTYSFFTLRVVKDIKADLDSLISQGYKIISFSFDSNIHAMVVVYDDMEGVMFEKSEGHKLTEWSEKFIDWARMLPYAQELIFLDELSEKAVVDR